MIYLETNELYYNTQIYFRKHYTDDLPNDYKDWAREYRKWLAEKGGQIVKDDRSLLRNALDIAPGYDRFGFENEHDATIFVLKWS